jgi:hypothetical protein
MNTFAYRTAVSAALLALLPVTTPYAQLPDLSKPGQPSGQSGGLGNLGNMGNMGSALSGKSPSAGSTGNVVGLLEFCIKNKYLGGTDASSVKDKLMGKLPGGSGSSDTGYKDGEKGLLKSSDGKQLDLSGGGLQAQVSKQVCDQVLSQGKSLL